MAERRVLPQVNPAALHPTFFVNSANDFAYVQQTNESVTVAVAKRAPSMSERFFGGMSSVFQSIFQSRDTHAREVVKDHLDFLQHYKPQDADDIAMRATVINSYKNCLNFMVYNRAVVGIFVIIAPTAM